MFGFDFHIYRHDAAGNLRLFEPVSIEDKYALANQRYFDKPVGLDLFEDDKKVQSDRDRISGGEINRDSPDLTFLVG